ncbi:hypothetical protein [Vulcanococcus sp.]|uniref:hypothetical protein n=1 Tax=Vulcanococcus sp. TaxID=2856995 RepID=UPI0037D9D89C
MIDPYAEERAFIATLPAWRRFLARLNWRSPLNAYVLVDEASGRRPSLKKAIKATLLLLLGAGVLVVLVWSQLLLVVLLAVPVLLIVAGVVGGLWRVIYDTLQEGESAPTKTLPDAET